jgi:hypothetical protein
MLEELTDSEDEINYSIKITSSIETLVNFHERNLKLLSYLNVLNMMLQIGEQIKNMEENNVTVPYIDINNIIVIDENKYILLDSELIEIRENKIQIVKPYKKGFLFSDELHNIVSLPSSMYSNNWIYSLGLTAIYLLTGETKLQDKDRRHYEILIENIIYTKLYFMIMRCLEKNHSERIYIYI